MNRRRAILMFHDVRPPGSARGYAVGVDQLLEAARVDSRDAADRLRSLEFTFDDGLVGTFRHGLPVLVESAIHARLFVTTSFLGKEGFMGERELREWAAAGMGVGSHGVTHRPLSGMRLSEARDELVESRRRLEDVLGEPISEFAYPGGNDSRALHRLAIECGYRAVYTSWPAFARDDAAVLPRFAVRSATPISHIRRLREGRVSGPWWLDRARWLVKRGIGAGPYRYVRRRVLARSRTTGLPRGNVDE